MQFYYFYEIPQIHEIICTFISKIKNINYIPYYTQYSMNQFQTIRIYNKCIRVVSRRFGTIYLVVIQECLRE